MSANSKIEWTEASWSPLLGCQRVSSGCDHCYAINTATIRAGNPNPKVASAFAGLTERRDGRLDWTGRINLLPDRLTQPLRWRKPKRIFVNSQADLFHTDVPDDYIAQVFAVMALAPQHTFQLLTKRHGRMRSLLNSENFDGLFEEAWCGYAGPERGEDPAPPLPLRNVWLGVSVENQQWADIRIPALLDTPAAVRWLSCEPLLGPIQLPDFVIAGAADCLCETGAECPPNIDWIVAGGESGPGARPMHPDWARSLRDQCVEGGIPFFFKQWGEYEPDRPENWPAQDWYSRPTRNVAVWPDGAHKQVGEITGTEAEGWRSMYRVGKKAAGRELDGRTWDEYPQAVSS